MKTNVEGNGKRESGERLKTAWVIGARTAMSARNRCREFADKAVLAPWVIVALLVILFAGCSKKHETSLSGEPLLPAATVSVLKIETSRVPVIEEVVGTVQPKLQAVIEARFSARVTAMPVTLGQAVKEGEVLVELASEEVQARLDQANASLWEAETDLNRFSKLLAQDAVTRSEFDAVQTRYTVAKAAVAEAQALAGHARIVAPFAGVVARKLAEVGDLAMPGKPLLELEGNTGLRLIANVPAMLAGQIRSRGKLDVRVDGFTNSIAGTVAEVSPGDDPASRTFRVKVDLPAAPGLRAGQFGRLAVPVRETEQFFLPLSAVIQRGQLDIVFAAVDGKAQMRMVRIGKQRGQEIEILAGLNSGERIVVKGAAQLRDGQPLEVK